MKQLRMLYTSSVFVNPDDVRRMTEAAVFIANEILIPASVQIQPGLSREDTRWVATRLAELHELGAVSSWDVEGALRQKVPSLPFGGAPDRIIDRETYLMMNALVDERLMEQRNVFLGDEANEYDGITEIVLGRHTLWRFAVAQALGANRALVDPRAQGAMNQFFSDLDRYQKFESLVLRRIEYRLGLPDVSQLDMRDIEVCRDLMPSFREMLLDAAEGQYDELSLNDAVERVATEITEAFLALTARLEIRTVSTRGRTWVVPASGFKEAAWDIVQMLFAPIILAKYTKLFFDWHRDGKRLAPLLLLLRLREIGSRRQAPRLPRRQDNG